jgi:acetolactate synthase-1/2/3 large subunit
MEVLHSLGVAQAFMVTGGGAMHLNDAIRAHGGLEVVCTLHEQAAATAADAYARQSGRPALCLVTAGPGGTNAITGVAAAWVDSVPMIVMSGQAKSADLVGASGLRQRGVQEIDIVSMVRGITKSAVTILDPASVRFEVERAFYLATSGRPGPVWLDFPLDVQGAPVDFDQLATFVPDEDATEVSRREAEEAAATVGDMLSSARRPLFLLGAGVRLAGAEEDVLALVEDTCVPVLATWPAQGVVGDDHPLFVGRPGALAARGPNFALQGADLLICLGARLDLATTGYDPKDFGRNAQKVVVEIDPFELAKLDGAIDFGFRGDVAVFVDSLRTVIRSSGHSAWTDLEGWVARCGQWRERYPVVTEEHRLPGEVVSTYHLAEVLSNIVTPDDVLAFGCSGSGIEIFIMSLQLRTGHRAIFGNAFGQMGAGPPTALGACLASGRRRTICVDGDGGLQLNIQELETIRRLGLPVKLFVLSNDGYASIRASQQRWFGHLIGADASSGMTLPPLDRVAEAYGWTYCRVRCDLPLADQVRDFLALDGPVLCEVPTPPNEPRHPAQTSEMLPDGGIRSLPIEDLAPRLDRDEFSENVLGSDGRFGTS